MSENKLSPEMAEQEFQRFAEEMDLDIDTATMDAEDIKGLEQNKNVLLRALRKGSLIIDDKGQPVYTPQRTENVTPIVFYEPTGASIMATDGTRKTEDTKKLFRVMADTTQRDPKTFSNLKMADLKVCLAIITLFLG